MVGDRFRHFLPQNATAAGYFIDVACLWADKSGADRALVLHSGQAPLVLDNRGRTEATAVVLVLSQESEKGMRTQQADQA